MESAFFFWEREEEEEKEEEEKEEEEEEEKEKVGYTHLHFPIVFLSLFFSGFRMLTIVTEVDISMNLKESSRPLE